jgi:hypothetical protein
MKTSIAVAVGSLLLLGAGLSPAQTTKAPASAPATATAQSGQPMGMGGPMGQMDEHMQKMLALHDKLNAATTPEDRQKVMDEQRKEMQAGMGAMSEMHGGAMMGGTGSGTMSQKVKPADAGAQMQMMQKRMDMMQMMMQTMMDQQGMMEVPKGG